MLTHLCVLRLPPRPLPLQALFDLEATNAELKGDLRDLWIAGAQEVGAAANRARGRAARGEGGGARRAVVTPSAADADTTCAKQ